MSAVTALDPAAPFVEAFTPVMPTGVAWKVLVSNRREKSIGFSVDDYSVVNIVVPYGASPADLVPSMRRVVPRLPRLLRIAAERGPVHCVKELVNGEGFKWLGVNHKLQLVDDSDVGKPCPCQCRRPLTSIRPGVAIAAEDGHATWSGHGTRQLTVRRDAASAATVVDWYCREGLAWLEKETPALLARTRVSSGLKFAVRDLGTRRLGSYDSGKHLVTLHWPLFQLERTHVLHTVLHEIAHAVRRFEGGGPHGTAWQRVLDGLLLSTGNRYTNWKEGREAQWQAYRHVWIGGIEKSAVGPAVAPELDDPWSGINLEDL